MPVAQTASVALLPDGRLLIVYHGGNPQGLWYLSGRFTSPDRFLTFDGKQHRLMLTDDSSRRGRNPALAVAPDGRVIVVYEGVADQELWYFSGFVSAAGELAGQEYRLMRGNPASRGHSPAIGISAENHVLVSYQGIDGETLLYLSGTIDSAGRIAGREFSLGEPQARQLGCAPSVAFGPERRIVIAYQGLQGQVIEGVSGTLDADGRIVGQGFSWDQGEPKRGIHPTASFDVRGNVFIVYEGVEDHKFRYVLGSWDQSGRLLGEEKLLSSGMDRR